MNCDFPGAHHFEAVTIDDDGGLFRETESEQFRKLFDERHDVIPSIARVDVLIDGGPFQECETRVVFWFRRNDEFRALHCATHEKLTLDRGARRRSADDSAPLEDFKEFAFG